MKKITQAELDEMLELHNGWLNDEERGVRAFFTNTDLSDLDFSNKNAEGGYFSGVSLRHTRLVGACFRYAVFEYASFDFADLTSAYFDNALLRDTTLRNTNLTETKFTDAKIVATDFTDVIFKNTDFTNAEIKHCIFPESVEHEEAFGLASIHKNGG